MVLMQIKRNFLEEMWPKLKSYQAEAKNTARKDPEKQKKRNDRIDGRVHPPKSSPKVQMPSGFSLKTSAIYDRIYLGFLYEI